MHCTYFAYDVGIISSYSDRNIHKTDQLRRANRKQIVIVTDNFALVNLLQNVFYNTCC